VSAAHRAAVEPTLTPRLRLEPIEERHAHDLWTLHRDEGVAYWYAGALTREQAKRRAADLGNAWRSQGVHKWMAYDRVSGELVGRGGLSRLNGFPVVGLIDAVLDDRAWRDDPLELGWALLSEHWGRGLATEIGRAGLDLAFGDLGASVVVAYTEVHNLRSRAVMERLDMRHVGDFVDEGLVEGREGVHPDASMALYAASADR
jgi:RimJ/RimL family protein N-acetyltransferase